MSGYTPVFASIYDGTLYGQWPAAAVFATLLPLCDMHGHIDMSLQAIAGRTGWPLDLLQQGIDQLTRPDPGSRTEVEQGRRLVLLDSERPWGWKVVNHAAYREKARLQAKSAREVESGKNRERMQSTAGHRRSPPTNAAHPLSNSNSNSNSKNPDRAAAQPAASDLPDGFDELRKAYPRRNGSQRWGDAEKAYRARVREGHTPAAILAGVRRYAQWCDATGKTGTETVQQAATFLGTNAGFLERWHPPPRAETAFDRVMRKNGGEGGEHGRTIESEECESAGALAALDGAFRG